jgi:type I restriction enzyme M protein
VSEPDPGDEDGETEGAILTEWLRLSNEEATLKKRLKDAEATLDAKAYAHYPKLTQPEIQTLVVDDKWLAALDAAIHGEMDRVSQALTRRVTELADRYEVPLSRLSCRVGELEARVSDHLAKMGFAS